MIPPAEFVRQFEPRLQFMLDQLNVHHQIEDLHYFPIFRDGRPPDPRIRCAGRRSSSSSFRHGAYGGTANALLQALLGDPEAAPLRRRLYGCERIAGEGTDAAPLDDEEDLIVPLILDRGEDALGVARTDSLSFGGIFGHSKDLESSRKWTQGLSCVNTTK